ncbi:flavodoxin reductase [Mucilaginibacter mali]|uniref:Flavodoxin reductase n=1 Tax=Mucilaginibacter mali TaxID=2740462 RepID=A0A7D4Q3B5_9SPHI|nr:FAD-binding oxidoreductase [Mucilaginibacter mali]QKJ32106.1 flavodoxin reductase [Mucilaginibacter mali]
MENIVKIIEINSVTHDVKSFRIEKPEGYTFEPGQATEVSINQPDWKDEKRPFTFTSLNEQPYLEFTIKGYHDHNGVTHQLHQLKAGDELILRDVWGTIAYKTDGYFIAGGAGITPFMAILRHLHHYRKLRTNQLFFANKTEKDIIYHQELDNMLGRNARYILSGEQNDKYDHGHIDKAYLQQHVKDFSKPFYVCGPDEMVKQITDTLTGLGAKPDAVVFEK